ncbi:hypothetical protein L1889_00845 [Paenalcaligenes niemegkensis]|uniref:hypothetical protein n=1 Tax=Paenalcaligenes niemegkensis TaxID=2895469 RepID=UPI001EE95361|nr:hypothetical protein [Paenalcaligenes niemegkensis]MCQ9615448.1 hypothetical protein [Paenalcaligenes niemegkensis]
MTENKVDLVGSGVLGVALLDPSGKIQAHIGAASQSRVRALLMDQGWLHEALERRLQVVTFTDAHYIAIVTALEEGTLVVFFGGYSETVLKFLMGVDFAFDIIEHLLLDPFDAMVMIDAKERLVFVSPIHEKYFGLKEGEGSDRK